MRVYRQLVADLLVGDYLRVVSQVPNEDQRPECFRRVEKIEYIEAPQTSSSPTASTTSAAGFPSSRRGDRLVPWDRRAAHLLARRRDRLGRRTR